MEYNNIGQIHVPENVFVTKKLHHLTTDSYPLTVHTSFLPLSNHGFRPDNFNTRVCKARMAHYGEEILPPPRIGIGINHAPAPHSRKWLREYRYDVIDENPLFVAW